MESYCWVKTFSVECNFLLGKIIFCSPLEGADASVLPSRFTSMFLRPEYFRGFSRVSGGKTWKNHTLLSSTNPLSSSAACNPKSLFLLLTAVQISPSVFYLEFVLPVCLFLVSSSPFQCLLIHSFLLYLLPLPVFQGDFPLIPALLDCHKVKQQKYKRLILTPFNCWTIVALKWGLFGVSRILGEQDFNWAWFSKSQKPIMFFRI